MSIIYTPKGLSILTKSKLVLRDIDIFKKFGRNNCGAGC